ncbi:ABC transporter ATP-binding protein [Candidatus Woesearchaeota archaeon]|nr:ABC transporter ATP-binding protein [Candidatus Woesearchaeota archaeon]
MLAASPPLQKFVSQSLAKGMPKADLQETLLKAGWPKELVSAYLQKGLAEHPSPHGKALLRIQSVSKALNGRKVLDAVSLDINEGEIFGIIGASGSGKTTLLNMIVGLLAPDAGDVQLLAGTMRSVAKDPGLRAVMGYSTQAPSFYPELTVEENIRHFSLLYGKTERQADLQTASLAKLVGLHDNRTLLAKELSGGMQKRLDLACALVNDPKVLILDEPVADLDVLLRKQLWETLGAIRRKGTTIVIASHFLTELEQVCDRIGILRNGRIAEVGTPDELRVIYSRNHEIKVELASHGYDELAAFLAKQQDVPIAKTWKEAGALRLQTAQPTAAAEMILQFCRQRKDMITALEMGRPTVRELFEELLR